MMLVTLMAIHSQEGSLWQCMHALAAAWPCCHAARGMEPSSSQTHDAPGGSQTLALQEHVGTWVGTACLQ
jgi:hypothetical protein